MDLLDPYTFYFSLPIYVPIKISSENGRDFGVLLSSVTAINAYNPGLKENTTYEVLPCYSVRFETFAKYGGVNTCKLICVRTKEEMYFYIHYNNKTGIFQKIGQFPSIATFHISQIKKYDKVLSKDQLKEFTRAIGLAANGVGIGSFVYLRRIFEDLIQEAHNKAKSDEGWDDQAFVKERMAEKIEMLKHHLPAFLVENKTLYSILSVGIHSLKEEECLAYFEVVKVGIELILDEKVEQYEKQQKLVEARRNIAGLTQRIKS